MNPSPEAGTASKGDGKSTRAEREEVVPARAPTAFEVALAERVGDLAARVTNLELLVRVRNEAKQGPDGVRFLGGFTRIGYERVAKQVASELLAALLERAA